MRYLTDLTGASPSQAAEPVVRTLDGPVLPAGKKRVNLLALGDVGGTLLQGLVLLGGDVIASLGICDLDPRVARRYEFELNQIAWPEDYGALPAVKCVEPEQLFDCDVFVFCASKGVPAVGAEGGGAGGEDSLDVRMVQFAGNRPIVAHYAREAVKRGFKGLFAVVSDPVDPLCKAALLTGLAPGQVRGFGLGVMNARAAYFAKRDPRFVSFLSQGRAFGPHGADLVIANSLTAYDDALSRELTALTVGANLQMREWGFKPYIAPALSSGAISLLLTLRGEWHYSSTWLESGNGGAFLGARNRLVPRGVELENPPLPQALYERIACAYENLCLII